MQFKYKLSNLKIIKIIGIVLTGIMQIKYLAMSNVNPN
jgi:hypothetical protein